MALIRNDLFIIFLFPGKRTNHCGMSEGVLYQKFILRSQFHGVQHTYCQKKEYAWRGFRLIQYSRYLENGYLEADLDLEASDF